MIRKWLRALIGWEDVGAALIAQRDHIVNLETLIQAQGREIQALNFKRDLREHRHPQILDWEQLQADFAANPENYKEN